MLMNYEFFINGEKRMPTQEEKQILMDRMMEKLGYERVVDDKDGDQKKAVV